MSLRKSPTPSPALLAANRANARKSTGPRTIEGKRRVALNALRSGSHAERLMSFLARADTAWRGERSDPMCWAGSRRRAGLPGWAELTRLLGRARAFKLRGFFARHGKHPDGTPSPADGYRPNVPDRDREELLALHRALIVAFLPDPENDAQMRYVRRLAIQVWLLKRKTDSRLASPVWRAAHLTPGARLPGAWRMRVPRTFGNGQPGWHVTLSVWVRRGRMKGGRRVRHPDYGWEDGSTLHAVLTLTASMRHPALGPGTLGTMPDERPLRWALKTKPVSLTKYVRPWMPSPLQTNSGAIGIENFARRP